MPRPPAGRAALVVAHPGHELRVHGWLEQARPLVFVLTDGSGGSGVPRLGSTARLIDRAGAERGSIFGRVPDRDLYAAILDHDHALFAGLASELAVRRLQLDAGVDLSGVCYTGVEVVPELIAASRAAHPGREFLFGDLTTVSLQRAELILCRDCLAHLPLADALRVVANLRRSGSGYPLTTTFPGCEVIEEVVAGGWRPLNLERPPFGFPPPVRGDAEGCPVPGYADKALGLWRLADLPMHHCPPRS
jgi:hypothetical protein